MEKFCQWVVSGDGDFDNIIKISVPTDIKIKKIEIIKMIQNELKINERNVIRYEICKRFSNWGINNNRSHNDVLR